MNLLDEYFLNLPPAHQSTMLVVREFLLAEPYRLVEKYKWRTPVYHHGDRYVCYVYHEKKKRRSYLAFVNAQAFEHELLRAEGREMMRFIILDPDADVPLEAIAEVLAQALPDLPGTALAR